MKNLQTIGDLGEAFLRVAALVALFRQVVVAPRMSGVLKEPRRGALSLSARKRR